MGSPTMWFEVAGKDHQALKNFYSQLFDWKLTDMDGMPYSTVEADNGGIPGGIGQAPEGHPGHVTFYVQVDGHRARRSRRPSPWAARGRWARWTSRAARSPCSPTRRATRSA